MAFPSSFEESNGVLNVPAGMSEDDCTPLSVCHATGPGGMPMVVSLWKFTAEELEEVKRTGRVWLGIVGATMPPAFVSGFKPIDKAEEK